VTQVTQILTRLQQGDAGAADELLGVVYDELRQLAARKMAAEAPGHTLQPTALVHEAWLRLGGPDPTPWRNRAHFFGAAAEAMRRILIDHARERHAQRRGGGKECVDIGTVELAAPGSDEEVLMVHDALERLAAEDPRKAEVVKLRYFAGLTNDEIAAALDLSVATVKREWDYARAWLFAAIRPPRTTPARSP
jgi:RNA polymerase sigma factor (TIGR02999 family)